MFPYDVCLFMAFTCLFTLGLFFRELKLIFIQRKVKDKKEQQFGDFEDDPLKKRTRGPSADGPPDLEDIEDEVGANEHAGLGAFSAAELWGSAAKCLCMGVVLSYLVSTLMCFLALPVLEDEFIYRPMVFTNTDRDKLLFSSPGLDHEDVFFETPVFKNRIHGWWLPTTGKPPVGENRMCGIYHHGSGGHLASPLRVMLAKNMSKFGIDLFTYDYPGYGQSSGIPFQESLEDAADAAMTVMESKLCAGVPKGHIIQIGHSLGGAVAVYVANTTGTRVLILQSTFSSIPDLIQSYFPLTGFLVKGVIHDKWESQRLIKYYRGALFMSHGTRDKAMPISVGKRLYKAAVNVQKGTKEFYEIHGHDGAHIGILDEAYTSKLVAFLKTVPELLPYPTILPLRNIPGEW